MANSVFLACKRCRSKKLKCDDSPKSCQPCRRSESECINVDLKNGKEYSRSYADELRERAFRLNAFIENASRSSHDHLEDGETSGSPGRLLQLAYHGDGSLMSVARLVEAGVSARTGDSPLQAISPEAHRQQAEMLRSKAAPAPHPPFDIANQLLQSYLTGPHLLHPFILRSTLLRDLRDLYSLETSMSNLARFRIYMVFAIGAVSLFRTGQHSIPPISYYASAKEHADEALGFGGLEHIQNLLLLVIFSVHHAVGTGNMWDLTRVAMRICIENKYHKKCSPKLGILEDQLRRRAFWTCYICDRHSSSMLGRPLAIEDDDIEVEMPFDADDDLVESCAIEEQDGRGFSETSIQRRHIQLRRITTKIRTELYCRRSPYQDPEGSDHLETRTSSILGELDQWRSAMPSLGVARSAYETEQWRDLNYYREKLKCFRALLQPERISNMGETLLQMHLDGCLKAAFGITRSYQQLRASDKLIMNWSCVHDIMSAGLSVLYCGLTWYDSARVQQGGSLAGPELVEEAIRACIDMLSYVSAEWQIVGNHLRVFKALATRVLALIHQHHQPLDPSIQMEPGASGLFNDDGAEVGEAMDNTHLSWAGADRDYSDLSGALMGPVSEAFTLDGLDWQDFDWINFDWQSILSTG